MKSIRLLLSLAALALSNLACSKHLPLARPATALTPPSRLCAEGEAALDCRSAQQVEQMLRGELEVLSMDDTPSGAQGAKILTLRSHIDGSATVFRVRWRPQSSAGLVNEPRKELAAYEVQKLFLHDDQLVAPPTAVHCFPLEHYRRFAPDEVATFPRTSCVLGFASYWLEGVRTVASARKADWLDDDAEGEGIWDAELFAENLLYRSSTSNANLLTYLINHGDAHVKQFMVEKAPAGFRTYIVDNSIAFLSIKNPMLFVREDWSSIQVPTLERRAINRLRQVEEEQLRQLSTMALLELRNGNLEYASPDRSGATAETEDEDAVSWRGDRLRIGMSRAEIALVRERMRQLLAQPGLEQRLE